MTHIFNVSLNSQTMVPAVFYAGGVMLALVALVWFAVALVQLRSTDPLEDDTLRRSSLDPNSMFLGH